MAPTCVITDFMGNDTEDEAAMLAARGIDVFVSPTPDPPSWQPQARTADAILTRHAPIEADTIDALERCKIIARYGTGHDNIDIDAAKRRRITVTAVVDYATSEVAEHTMALILSLARALPAFERSVRDGAWTPRPLPIVPRLEGLTLGLFGCGRIGAAVAARARAFGMAVLGYDPYASSLPDGVARATSVEELLRSAHVLSLHAPLTEETAGAIGGAELDLLPGGSIVVNVARGGLLDLDAACAAVDAGRLGGLGIDVAPSEPLPGDHPARHHQRIIVTPHVGYYSTVSVAEAKRRSVEEIIRVLQGERPRNAVYDPADAPPE